MPNIVNPLVFGYNVQQAHLHSPPLGAAEYDIEFPTIYRIHHPRYGIRNTFSRGMAMTSSL